MISKPNIETRIANRARSVFSALGTIINDFYLEAGIYFVGGFNAALVAWDIYTDLLNKSQPLPYAVAIAIIAFIAVEGLAVYLVGAAAKTNNSLLWFFSVVFASFFTFAHYQEMNTQDGTISRYIMLAIPFFVVIGYWARTVKIDIETDHALVVKQRYDEMARKRQLEDEKIAHSREVERLKLEQKQAQKMAQIEAQKEVSLKGQPAPNRDSARVTPTLDTINDTKKLTADTRRQKVLDLIQNEAMTYSEIATELGVSLSTVKRDVKSLNGSIKK